MTINESIPQVWDDERDNTFFRITVSLFTPAYCYGASVLLASYDADDVSTPIATSPAPAVAAAAAATPATPSLAGVAGHNFSAPHQR